jgi:hypothetical protein
MLQISRAFCESDLDVCRETASANCRPSKSTTIDTATSNYVLRTFRVATTRKTAGYVLLRYVPIESPPSQIDTAR